MINKIVNKLARITGVRPTYEYPRPSIKKAIEIFGKKPITAIEIGTDKGYNAKDILKRLNISKIYLIDPYTSYEGYNKSYASSEKIAKKELHKWNKKGKIVWLRDYSDNAVKKIKGKVDFVYVDGNHSYDYVLNDLRNYWPLVKKSGLLAGHDINFDEVSRAICDFIKERDIYFTADKKDWWIVKR